MRTRSTGRPGEDSHTCPKHRVSHILSHFRCLFVEYILIFDANSIAETPSTPPPMPEKTKIHLRSSSQQPHSLQPTSSSIHHAGANDSRPSSSRSARRDQRQSTVVNEPIIPPISSNGRSRKVKEVKAKSNQTRRKTEAISKRRPDQPLPEIPNSRHSSLHSNKSNNYEVLPR